MVLWSFLVKTRYGITESTHVNSIKYKILKARIYTAVKATWNRGTPSSKQLCCTRHKCESTGPTSTSINEVSCLSKLGLLGLYLTLYHAKSQQNWTLQKWSRTAPSHLCFVLMDFPTAATPLSPCLHALMQGTTLVMYRTDQTASVQPKLILYIYFCCCCCCLNIQQISHKTILRQWPGCCLPTLERLEALWVKFCIFGHADEPKRWPAGCVCPARTENPICRPLCYSSMSGEYSEKSEQAEWLAPAKASRSRCFLFLGLLRNEQGFPAHAGRAAKAQPALNWEVLDKPGVHRSLVPGFGSRFIHRT